jgi:hypothetical protein
VTGGASEQVLPERDRSTGGEGEPVIGEPLHVVELIRCVQPADGACPWEHRHGIVAGPSQCNLGPEAQLITDAEAHVHGVGRQLSCQLRDT